jgi:histone acetyltransferase (RNA polymerase elongator complex component)
MILPVFLTGLGCFKVPCVFCDQGIASSKAHLKSPEEVKQRIEDSFKEYLSNINIETIKYPLEVAFYGASFTALDFAYQKELLKYLQEVFEAYTKKRHQENMLVRISTRPDRIKKEELLDLKIRFNLGLVEIGVQSMNNDVLALANRGHTKQDVVRASRELTKIGLAFSCHQMIGLPGASTNDDIESALEIVKLKTKYVRIHPTLVLKGTELEKMYRAGEYKPLELNEAVNTTEKILRIYRKAGIQVIRIALHPNELLKDSIVAGPWHPSFRELVESQYLMREASNELAMYEGQKVQLTISPQDETYVRGEGNSNYNKLLDIFKLQDIELIKDTTKPRGTISVKSRNV